MSASKSLTLVLIALAYTSLAISPLSLFAGLNNELGVQNEASINQCLSKYMTRNNEESDVCLDALDTYFNALFLSSFQVEGQTLEVVNIETIGAAFRAIDNLNQENSFVAGQEIAHILKQAAVAFRLISHERQSNSPNVTINSTEFLLGLNDQLAITNGTQLSDCLGDSSQTDVIIEALLSALKQEDIVSAISDIVKLIKYIPGIKSTCATSVQGIEVFAKPIEQAVSANSTQFFNTVNANLQKNPFEVAADSMIIIKDLDGGEDYNAGITSGKLVQIALKGIISN